MTEQAFEQLKKAVREGDNSPLTALIKAVAPNCIRQLQLKFACSLEEAKDVFSEAFIKFHDLLVADKIAYGNIEGYMFAICRSTFIDKYSKKRNLAKRKEVLMDYQKNPLEQYSLKKKGNQNDLTFDPLIKAEHEKEIKTQQEKELELMTRALKGLHPRCRQLLKLAIMQKVKYAQIVEIMDFANTQTVKSAKYNCLKRLKAIIKKMDK